MDKSRLEVIPYLSFSGDCEQALEVYIRAFGGEVIYISRWSEENCESPEQAGKVMHAEFRIGCTRMSGGDSFEKKGPNTNIKLMVHMGSTEEAENAISALLEGFPENRAFGGRRRGLMAPSPPPRPGRRRVRLRHKGPLRLYLDNNLPKPGI